MQVLRQTSEGVFVPLTVGGGIRAFTDADGKAWSALDVAAEYFRSGADKVADTAMMHAVPAVLQLLIWVVAAGFHRQRCCGCSRGARAQWAQDWTVQHRADLMGKPTAFPESLADAALSQPAMQCQSSAGPMSSRRVGAGVWGTGGGGVH